MAFGQEENTGNINIPGTYKDPQSGKELTVVHNAAADALVRMGWVRQADAEGEETPDLNLTPAMAAEKAEKAKAKAEAKQAKEAEKAAKDAAEELEKLRSENAQLKAEAEAESIRQREAEEQRKADEEKVKAEAEAEAAKKKEG